MVTSQQRHEPVTTKADDTVGINNQATAEDKLG
jgi:hypothetical protein